MTKLPLRVAPGAKQSALKERLADGRWKVAIAAPPLEGRANEELVRFLAEVLDLPRSRVRIAHGGGGRDKVVEVDLDRDELAARLLRAAGKEAE